MANTSELDVRYIARLARINLDDAEVEVFQKQLDDVIHYVEKLREADVSHVELANVLPMSDVFRQDTPRDWFTAEQALINAPRQVNGLFIVPKVVE